MNPFRSSRLEIARVLKTDLAEMPNVGLRALATDSRQVNSGQGVVFVCLKGPRHDGHRFAAELYSKGVRDFICEKGRLEARDFPGAVLYETDDTLRALQELAAQRRADMPAKVIGITGSNGKTIVKEWLARALSDSLRVMRSPGSFNSQIGVPLSLIRLEPSDDIGIAEAGISQPGEMARLEEIIRPDIAVLTNIGEAHLENFSSKRELAIEKSELAKRASVVVYRSDYEEWSKALADFPGEKFNWSTRDTGARMNVKLHPPAANETPVTVFSSEKEFSLTLPGTDAASIENGLTVVATLLALGISPDYIAGVTERFRPPAFRNELVEAAGGGLILSDVSNSDLVSLSATLDFARAHLGSRKLTLIMSDILQSGRPREEMYTAVADLVRDRGVSRLIGIGRDISASADLFDSPPECFPDTESFLARSAGMSFEGEMVVVKGAGVFRMERIVERLALRSHQTRLITDLNRLEQNLNLIRERVGRETGIIAVVKASAYGSGSEEIASVLEFNRVDYLAVAFTDEGVRLRKAGISLPIMVLNTVPETNHLMVKYRLEPEIFSFETLRKFLDVLNQSELTSPFPIHVKLDTGMHRLGFLPDEDARLAELLMTNRHLVTPATVFSHLAASDNPAHDDFTRQQLQEFTERSAFLESQLGHSVRKHLANTSGLFRFPEARFQLVRTGIGLYGIAPDAALTPVHRMVSVIIQVKEVKKGQSIGYDRSFTASADMRIGVVAAGYADGIPRSLSNGKGFVGVGDKTAPIVGKICMDMMMIDLTGIPAEEGDEVELFGRKVRLSQLAASCEQIPYEILSGISSRIKRVYVREP